MRRILYLLMAGGLLAGVLAAGAAAQSLGDVAREARKNKRPSPTTKVYTNDDLPATAGISVASAPAPGAAASDKGKKEAGESPEDQKKLADEWRAKFKEQKDKIELLQRELDLVKGEYGIWYSRYYADAGNQVRGYALFRETEKKYRDQMDQKAKELQEAKDKLEEMREEARKAGLPSSVRE